MYFSVGTLHRVSLRISDARTSSLNASRYSSALRGRSDLATETCVVGLSAGLLAAAAVALAPATPALIPLAVEVVLIAFRIGLYVRSIASHLDVSTTQDSDASWSYAVPGMTEDQEQTALAIFHKEKVTYLAISRANIHANHSTDPPTVQSRLYQLFHS